MQIFNFRRRIKGAARRVEEVVCRKEGGGILIKKRPKANYLLLELQANSCKREQARGGSNLLQPHYTKSLNL